MFAFTFVLRRMSLFLCIIAESLDDELEPPRIAVLKVSPSSAAFRRSRRRRDTSRAGGAELGLGDREVFGDAPSLLASLLLSSHSSPIDADDAENGDTGSRAMRRSSFDCVCGLAQTHRQYTRTRTNGGRRVVYVSVGAVVCGTDDDIGDIGFLNTIMHL